MPITARTGHRSKNPGDGRASPGIWPVFQTAADDGGITGPVPAQTCVCRAKTCTWALRWCFSRSLACSAVLADQAVDDLPALDPGGHIDRLARCMQRRSLFPRLMRPMLVVVPRVLGQDPPEVSFAVDQQVVKALAPQCSHVPLRKGICPGPTGPAP